jgi:RNA polymerase sigma-70 factor (ECF subfamily)
MRNEEARAKFDDETFKQAVLDYKERLFLVILRFVRNREDARDLTQEAFVKAYRSRAQFRGDSGLYTWLYKIAVNLALNYKTRSRVSSFESIDDNPELHSDSDPSAGLMSTELTAQINAAIDTLPPRQRMVFNLRYFEQMPHAEIATMLSITEGAVKANYHQAINKLRIQLKDYVVVNKSTRRGDQR